MYDRVVYRFSVAASLSAFLALWSLPLWSPPASAMNIQVEGDTVVLSGPVVGTECETLERLLSEHRIGRVVLTNSGGGNANAGYCVGALIRDHGLSTEIRGRCASSCSRMWLGGVVRRLEGPESRVGLHGNYGYGGLLPDAPQKLRNWIPFYAPSVDRGLMEQWIHLPTNKWMMYFYNDRAELCDSGRCTRLEGHTALSAGLATQ